jgi:hypothetical protein
MPKRVSWSEPKTSAEKRELVGECRDIPVAGPGRFARGARLRGRIRRSNYAVQLRRSGRIAENRYVLGPDEPCEPGKCGVCGVESGGESYCSRACIDAEVLRLRMRGHIGSCSRCLRGQEWTCPDGRGFQLLFVEARTEAVNQSKYRSR